jgi:hypothetical protein
MAKWKYASLAWIHEVREKNYEATKDKTMEAIMKSSIRRARKRAGDYGG